MQFLTGCWSHAFSPDVEVFPPSRKRDKVFWRIGCQVAAVNFNKLCSNYDQDEEREEDCPTLPQESACTAFESCTITCPDTQYVAINSTGGCYCASGNLLNLEFPLRIPSDAKTIYSDLQAVALTQIAPRLDSNQVLKQSVVDAVSAVLRDNLLSCLTADSVEVQDSNINGTIDFLTAWVLVIVRDPTNTATGATILNMLQTSAASQTYYNQIISAADNAICPDTNSELEIACSFGSSLLSGGDCDNLGFYRGTNCGACSTDPTSCCLCGGINNNACLLNFSSCPTQGPEFFSTAPNNGVYFALLDETGKAYSEGQIEIKDSVRTADGYLALSPIYVVIAVAVVAALVVGSIVGVVIYHRRHPSADADSAAVAKGSGWVMGKKSSLNGRTRAAGIMN